MAFIPDNPTQPQGGSFVPDNIEVKEAQGLIKRFGKQFYNRFAVDTLVSLPSIIPQTILATTGQTYIPSVKELKTTEKIRTTLEAPVPQAETIPEKVTDIGAGIGAFITQVAALKKIAPAGTSERTLWEIQNLLAGGQPGQGVLMHSVFKVPGKVIKGKSLVAKTGRVASESAIMGTTSAAEQKITTGEINWEDVGISAGIAPTLHTVGLLKRGKQTTVPTETIRRYPNEVPLPQQNVYVGKDSGKIYIEPFAQAGSKQITKLETVGDTSKIIHTETGEELVARPDLTRQTGESETTYLQRVYGTTDKQTLDIKQEEVSKNLPLTETEKLNQKLTDWITNVKKKPVEEQDIERSKLRSKQAGGGTRVLLRNLAQGKGAGESIRAAKAAYKHKMKVVEVEPPDFTNNEWDIYSQKILDLFPPKDASQQFQRTRTQDALDKIRNGYIPTNAEFELLEPIFGKKTTELLYQKLSKQRAYSPWLIIPDIIQAFKLKLNWDLQTSRQGRTAAALHPIIYIKSIRDNAKALANARWAEQTTENLINSPGFKTSEQYLNYVADTGYSSKRLEYYGTGLTERIAQSKNPWILKYGEALKATERGATVGINSMMYRLWNVAEKTLANKMARDAKRGKVWTTDDIHKWRLNRGKTINTTMKLLRAKSPEGKQIQKYANYLLYSSGMTVSRPLSIKAVLANKGSRGYAGEILASNIASIFAISSIPALIGWVLKAQNPDKEPVIDGGINPIDGMFGKIRIKGTVYDFSMGDAAFYRTLVRLGVSAYIEAQKIATGKEQTKVWGKTVQPWNETLSQYLVSRETAALGWAKTMLTGKDWLGKPISRLESTVRAITPSVLESMFDAGRADGLWEALTAGMVSETSVGTATYPVPTFSTRNNFRNTIADREYNRTWEDLTPTQQQHLSFKYKETFDKFTETINKERVENPFDPKKIIEEEKRAGDYIRKNLDKSVKSKLEEVSLNISRSPQDFFLNDDRYNRYKNLVVEQLNNQVGNINTDNLTNYKVRKAVLEDVVTASKNMAYMQLLSEINEGLI